MSGEKIPETLEEMRQREYRHRVTFIGGHHDGKTMLLDPAQDKIVLAWAALHDQEYDENGAPVGGHHFPGGYTTPGTATGRDVYYRNPGSPSEFLIDDGKDYRLARYWLADLRDEIQSGIKAMGERMNANDLENERGLSHINSTVKALREIVGAGIKAPCIMGVNGQITDPHVSLTDAIIAVQEHEHQHAIGRRRRMSETSFLRAWRKRDA